MARAPRLIVLDTTHERIIQNLCIVAETAVWTLRTGSDEDRKRISDLLAVAWKKVSHEVMP